jgi:tight adherence protein B
MHSYDLELIVTSMLIQRRTGGNLAEVLENIADTIRDRLKIYGEIQTLTAEGRLSGYILAALPFALMLILQLINNNYLNDMISTGIGRVLLGGALLMIGVGFLVIRRLSNIQV